MIRTQKEYPNNKKSENLLEIFMKNRNKKKYFKNQLKSIKNVIR